MNGCKNNVMTIAKKHHESTGHYFSWSNRGNYGMVVNSSVGPYAYKSGAIAIMNRKFIEYMMNTELQSSISNLKKSTTHLAFSCSISDSCGT